MDDRGSRGGAGIRQLTLSDLEPDPGSASIHVLLDLDGCLIDSREPILRSLNAALRSFGLTTITAADLEPLVGPPLHDGVTALLADRDADLDLVPPIIAAYREHYADLSIELAALVPGMDGVVDQLASGHTLAVVTTKPTVFAEPIIEALGLRDRFAAVVGPKLHAPEPKRVTLGRALDELEAAPGDAVMVGDRRFDIEAAGAHGVPSVGVTWGHGTADELRAAGADRIVDAPAQLPAAISAVASSRPPGGGSP